MTETATIRVPKETRDSLSVLAERQGISVSKLLTLFASREHLHAIYAAERAATEADMANPDAAAEYELWDETGPDDLI